jgi:hypothetical protein
MATEITARAAQPARDAPDDGDYETFSAALSASARGRAFLSEYTRRNRNADTEQLLAAIAQLQQTVAGNSSPKITDQIKAELRALLDEIAAAQCELEASITATKATRLADLIALVARRITAIMAMAWEESPPPAEVTQLVLQRELKQESKDESEDIIARTHLAVVPLPEQPELPIPSPLVTPLPPIALVRSEPVMAEVAFVGPPPASAVEVTKPARPTGPLASIMALSEDERLALFT